MVLFIKIVLLSFHDLCFLQVENWSAFAPDFKELEENEEYDERESEFDIEDEDRSVRSVELDGKSGDESVDITTVQPIPAFCSSDEDPLNVSITCLVPIGTTLVCSRMRRDSIGCRLLLR